MKKRQNSLPKFIPFGEPKISRSTEREVIATLRSGWIGAGPKTRDFEQAFAEYTQSRYSVAVSSCTAGLHLSLLVSGIGAGDEVITTPLTFVATANAIAHVGARVVFADVDPQTYNLSAQAVEKATTKRTAAILPVHFAGLPCDLAALGKIALRHHVPIIEDAAHAIGARYKGRFIGASGNLVVFSLYPNKNITSCEGGMITLRNSRQAHRLQILRMHGLDADAWKRFYRRSLKVSLAVEPGYKYNLTDLQSTIGMSQLRHVEAWQRIREKYAALYDHAFDSLPGVVRQFRPKDIRMNRHALHLYTLRLDQSRFKKGSRDAIVRELLRRNIGASIHYFPVHLHPVFRKLGFRKGDFPVAEKICEEIFTLPLTPHMTIGEIKLIAKITSSVIQGMAKV